LAAVIQLAPAASSAQEAEVRYPPASPGVPAKAFPLFGRPVAEIVSPSRSTEATRDANEEAQQLARLMGLRSGMVVGDVGAGSGYHTVRLSRVVGPSGTVVAQDVRQDYLTGLAKRVQQLKLTNVRIALGEPHDPRLPAASLDAAVLVHMYHEIAEPYVHMLTGDAGYLAIFEPPLKRPQPSAIVPCPR
jgi:predicted methyltransferase